jgi:hypothetical protein
MPRIPFCLEQKKQAGLKIDKNKNEVMVVLLHFRKAPSTFKSSYSKKANEEEENSSSRNILNTKSYLIILHS